MAAFALGLLADKRAVPALTAALQDADPRVRGRAAEALGLIGDTGSAAAVGQMVSGYVKAGAIASLAPDEEQLPATPGGRRRAARTVRARATESLRAARGRRARRLRPRLRAGGRSPTRCSASTIRARLPALQQLARRPAAIRAPSPRAASARLKDAGVGAAAAHDARAGEGRRPVTVVGGPRARRRSARPTAPAPILALLNADETDPEPGARSRRARSPR